MMAREVVQPGQALVVIMEELIIGFTKSSLILIAPEALASSSEGAFL